MNHTPGPWRKHTTIGKTYANVRGIDGRCVADCGSRCDPTAQANATLIAAAPEMLEALRAFNQVWGGMTLGRGSREESIALDKVWNLVRSAIAKAEGGL